MDNIYTLHWQIEKFLVLLLYYMLDKKNGSEYINAHLRIHFHVTKWSWKVDFEADFDVIIQLNPHYKLRPVNLRYVW